MQYVQQHIHPGVREFHIVGGHNDNVPFQYYVDSLRALNEHFPDVTLKAYTAAEIDFFTRISGLSIREVLEQLRAAGLKTLTGEGRRFYPTSTAKKCVWTKPMSRNIWRFTALLII